ncbi:hypothetical protein [Leptospira noguchii]|uniref:hypothetical protein n=1 Tax=Leptospira noguchii TaxID=28182 RepID=UPI000A547F90|nr:hypothetical protein [Leptospira noguchii]UOG47359.1 hypothetical protein MAL00_09665 [Leptospira noguchii]
MWGGNSVLQRICRNSHRFNIEIQILVGLVLSIVSSIEFEKFRRNWSEKNSMKRFYESV